MTPDKAPFLDAVEDVSRSNSKVPQSAFLTSGRLAIVDQGKDLIAGYTDDVGLACKVNPPVIVFGDHTRAFKFVDFPFVMGADGVKVLKVRDGWDTKYVFHYLRSCSIPSAGYARHFKFLKDLDVPRPELDDQRRIAAVLDQADALRAKRRRALAHLDDLTHSIFLDMFGDVVSNDRGWPMKPFGEVCQTRLGKMLDAKQQTGQQARPYLRNANVQWFRFELEQIMTMDFDAKSRATLRLEPGDLLICEGGQPGRAAIWRGEIDDCYYQKALHRARADRTLAIPEFLVHLLWFVVNRGGLKDHVTSATIAHLTGEKLKAMRIALPPLSLQRQFAVRMGAIAHQRARIEGAEDLDASVSASLQARAFSGQL